MPGLFITYWDEVGHPGTYIVRFLNPSPIQWPSSKSAAVGGIAADICNTASELLRTEY